MVCRLTAVTMAKFLWLTVDHKPPSMELSVAIFPNELLARVSEKLGSTELTLILQS